jgi:hypothetical protein
MRLERETTMPICLRLAAFLSAASLSTTALAQAPQPPAETTSNAGYSEQRVDGSQVVRFVDDPLATDPWSAYGFTIRRPPRVLRAQLIRPRVNFVSELLKTVENL